MVASRRVERRKRRRKLSTTQAVTALDGQPGSVYVKMMFVVEPMAGIAARRIPLGASVKFGGSGLVPAASANVPPRTTPVGKVCERSTELSMSAMKKSCAGSHEIGRAGAGVEALSDEPPQPVNAVVVTPDTAAVSRKVLRSMQAPDPTPSRF